MPTNQPQFSLLLLVLLILTRFYKKTCTTQQTIQIQYIHSIQMHLHTSINTNTEIPKKKYFYYWNWEIVQTYKYSATASLVTYSVFSMMYVKCMLIGWDISLDRLENIYYSLRSFNLLQRIDQFGLDQRLAIIIQNNV